jgi:nucleoside-diphosphate-sugar epimerase
LRVLVLGGTRFVGPFAVRRLAAEGHQVAIFHRGETEPELPPTVKHFHGDFGRFGEHLDALRAFAPDVVVDLVPFVDKAGHGVGHFAHLAERAVVLSSGDVYRAFARLLGSEPGEPDPVPLNEESPLREGASPDLAADIDYDNLEVERALRFVELPVTVLRLAVVYGPGDPYNRVGGYVRRMDDRREAIMLEERVAPWRWSREYVENVAAAIAAVVADARSADRVYNVAPKTASTEEQWVHAIAEAAGWRGEIVRVPSEVLPDAMRLGVDVRQDLVMDSSRIRRELGFVPPVGLEEGLRRTVEWARRTPLPAPDYAAEDAALASVRSGLA